MNQQTLEPWEREVTAGHRWRTQGEQRAAEELERLRRLRAAAGSLTPSQLAIVDQVMMPEICNWALLEIIPRLATAIGCGQPDPRGTGHQKSLTAGRWRQIWAYYLACRQWLAAEVRPATGYMAALEACDPQGAVLQHVADLLGPRDALKELYVERFCLCLEAWLDSLSLPPPGRPRLVALKAAAAAIEAEILRQEPDPRVPMDMIRLDDHSILQPCHHKLFRRYDIILSSIGDGKWRRTMPQRGTDGAARADELEPFLAALEQWADGTPPAADQTLAADMAARLGTPDAFKRFAVALLVSLLRSQQLKARQRAAKRASPMQ
ncbi:MAG: hypothetical protein JXL80_16185 [Planctomycetes bacterium]|nr:hypothetical protein [Planctomycetota bacterium]